MKAKLLAITVLAFFLAVTFCFVQDGPAQEPKPNQCIDKEECARMLRFGRQSYMRGKYLDAKQYFRKAVQADPTSATAWEAYDLVVIFALAEKVEKKRELIEPGVSEREELGAGKPAPPPPKPAAEKEEEEEPGFVIIQDEGC